MTLFGLLQKPKVYAEVLLLSDVNAKEDLLRTPRGCPRPPNQITDDNAQKWYEKQWFFNDFEMALDALGELPNIKTGSPMAPQSGQEMA